MNHPASVVLLPYRLRIMLMMVLLQGAMVAGHYDYFLVATSFVIATLGAWAALDLSGRVYLQKSKRRRFVWLSLGSFSMGTGIWSMHYVGMLAYRMSMPVFYHWPTVLTSMIAALSASSIALWLVARRTLSWTSTVMGGVVMGSAIASMHYIGMAAMRMPMTVAYSVPMVTLSVVVAVVISVVGLRLTFGSKKSDRGWSGKKAMSALVMGLAIPTMHYLGMAAVTMVPQSGLLSSGALSHTISISTLSTSAIVLTSILIICAAILSSRWDHHVSQFESALHGTTRSYAQLQAHYERLQGAFRAGGFGIWECDPATQLFYVDASLRKLFDVPQDGKPIPRDIWRASVHGDDLAVLDERWKQALLNGDRYENEYRVVHANGEVRTVHSVATLIRHEDGLLKRVLGMTWDVTAERTREREVQEQATRFRLTLDAIGDAVLSTDESLRITFMNPVACQLTGWDEQVAVGRRLQEVARIVGESTDALSHNSVQHGLQQEGPLLAGNGVLIGQTGKRFDVLTRVDLIGQGQAAVITFRDVTENRRMEKQLLYQANHDSLTGLESRAAFENQLRKLWEENRYSGRMHSICMLDLDRFKIVNDSSGHAAGDQLLKDVAKILHQELRATDTAARMGGDEFMLLLTDMSADEAREPLARILQRIGSHQFTWQGRTYTITASGGIVSFDCFSPEPEILVSQADAAAFAAKREGRNRLSVYVEQGSAADQYHEMQVAADLRRCMEENCFELYAQPIVPSEAVHDQHYFEILLRMKGSDGKLVSPALFIPAAERNGLMTLVDRWVIRNTLALYSRYKGGGSQLRFAINLSGDSLSDPTLWAFVSEQLLLSKVDPTVVTFELTETAIVGDLDAANSFIESCRRAGCRIALDDFGTGLSSLSYLKQFTLDTIKIDGGFIKTLLQNPMDQSIVRAIGDVARSIGATTVAECVEDAATITLVRALGINYIQGWATGKPLLFSSVLRDHQEGPSPGTKVNKFLESGAFLQ